MYLITNWFIFSTNFIAKLLSISSQGWYEFNMCFQILEFYATCLNKKWILHTQKNNDK